MLPLVAFLLDRFVVKRTVRQTAVPIGAWFVLALPFMLLARLAQPETELGFVTPLWARPLIAADALAFYLYKLLVPFRLVADYGRAPDVVIANGWIYLTWLAPTVLAVLLWRSREKRPLLVHHRGVWLPISPLQSTARPRSL